MFTHTQTGTARATLTKGKLDTAKTPPLHKIPPTFLGSGGCNTGGS